jgi:hypothetical protein
LGRELREILDLIIGILAGTRLRTGEVIALQ